MPSFIFSEKKRSYPILYIPELIDRIFAYLGPSDLASCSRAMRLWNEIATPFLYRHICFHSGDVQRLSALRIALDPHFAKNTIKFEERLEWTLLIITQIASWVQKLGLPRALEIGAVNTIASLSKALNRKKKTKGICFECADYRRLAEKTGSRELLVPKSLGQHTHRFRGAVYGIVPLKTSQKLKDQPSLKDKTPMTACIQFHVHPATLKWSHSKATTHLSHGPFLKSFSCNEVIRRTDYRLKFVTLFSVEF